MNQRAQRAQNKARSEARFEVLHRRLTTLHYVLVGHPWLSLDPARPYRNLASVCQSSQYNGQFAGPLSYLQLNDCS